jgi:small subunit ribosomal protein S20
LQRNLQGGGESFVISCRKSLHAVVFSNMAITSSAKKAIRSSGRKHVFNLRRKSALYDATKLLTKAIASKNVTEAEKLLPAAYKAIDKACKCGVIKKNTASRKKARLAASIKRTK